MNVRDTPLHVRDLRRRRRHRRAPRTGRVWAWFGGATSPDLATVCQNIYSSWQDDLDVPPLETAKPAGNSADYLRVLVDGTQVFQVFAGDARFTRGYAPVDD